jgi:spoIIIJ-associated protein
MADSRFDYHDIAARVQPLLSGVIRLSGLRLTFEVQNTAGAFDRPFENPDVLITFTGPDADLLLENKAEVLLSLEHIVTETLRLSQDDRGRVMLDCHEYRMMRIDELRLAAQAAAEKVRKTGMPYSFSPMTSRERRVLHMALRGENGIRSQSEGVGPGRHVVITPTHPAPSQSRPVRHHPSR